MAKTLSGKEVIINLQSRDYEDFRTQALEIAQIATPEWTDFFPHDPGVVIAEGFAGIADALSYTVDRGVGESHWSTAQLRKSLLNMAELINYTPSPAVSAGVFVDVVVNAAGTLTGIDSTSGVAPFRISTNAGTGSTQYSFELESEQTPGAAGTFNYTFVEGRTILDESIGFSDLTTGQSFTINQTPLTSDPSGAPAVKVKIAAVVWTRVANFSESDATDKHYTIQLDSVGRGTITFGDGVNGQIPSAVEILATYRIGGGSGANNISAAQINSIVTALAFVDSVQATASPSAGDDAETIEEIRVNAPKSYATQDRVVTHEDYEAASRAFSGVHKVKADNLDGSPYREAVYIATTGDNPVPTGTWDPDKQSGTGLLGLIGAELVSKKCAAVKVYMLSILPVDVDLEMIVHAKSDRFNAVVTQSAKTAADAYIRGLSTNSIPILRPLSGLAQAIENIDDVDYVDIIRFTRKPYIEELLIGVSNSTISSVVSRGELFTEEWVIRYTSATTFQVEGSVSGVQTASGTSGTEYTVDNGSLTFTITAGSVANKVNDQYGITTSDTVGNIAFKSREIAIFTDNTKITTIGGIG